MHITEEASTWQWVSNWCYLMESVLLVSGIYAYYFELKLSGIICILCFASNLVFVIRLLRKMTRTWYPGVLWKFVDVDIPLEHWNPCLPPVLSFNFYVTTPVRYERPCSKSFILRPRYPGKLYPIPDQNCIGSIPYRRLKRTEKHTLHCDTYPYRLGMGVPPPGWF